MKGRYKVPTLEIERQETYYLNQAYLDCHETTYVPNSSHWTITEALPFKIHQIGLPVNYLRSEFVKLAYQ